MSLFTSVPSNGVGESPKRRSFIPYRRGWLAEKTPVTGDVDSHRNVGVLFRADMADRPKVYT